MRHRGRNSTDSGQALIFALSPDESIGSPRVHYRSGSSTINPPTDHRTTVTRPLPQAARE